MQTRWENKQSGSQGEAPPGERGGGEGWYLLRKPRTQQAAGPRFGVRGARALRARAEQGGLEPQAGEARWDPFEDLLPEPRLVWDGDLPPPPLASDGWAGPRV